MRFNENALAMSLVLVLASLAWGAGLATPSYSATNPASGQSTSSSEPRVIEVDATDFAFSMPDSVEGGWVTFRMRNTGQEVHNVSLRKLNEGVTFDQVLPLVAQGAAGDLRRFVTSTSGVGHVSPGLSADTTLNLEPGDYVVICPITSPDGIVHMAKGMFKPLRVTVPNNEPVPEPLSAATITLRDFSFDLPASLEQGATYRVVNDGPQIHELAPIKLADGKTADDAVKYITAGTPTGPALFEEVGGPAGASAGTTMYWAPVLAPGQYVFVCNVPDPGSGKTHVELGMIKTFVVK
jgi:hypothetical protein